MGGENGSEHVNSAGRFGREENDSIRFDSTKMFIVCSPLHLHHHMASLTMVMLILFFVSIFVVHITEC